MRKIRQHVNPLSAHFMRARAQPVARPPGLAADCPIEVELGCADAEFSFARAAACPEALMVGLDIREPCLARNRVRAADEGLANLLFGYVNLNVDIDRVFAPASVDRFHLLFPDPWVKKSHQKRRVIEPALVASLAAQLRPGGELHVASDVFDVALEIMATVEDPELAGVGLVNLAGPWSFWRGNPFAEASRREQTTLRRQQRVWRMRYVRSDMSLATGDLMQA
ncbi:tRNA (guanine(46)-N(7))-methyltransferase TrmB [Nannocystis pusilla]|uniref:tRNA (guanine(46)-N(7))-methyltransferase TrmB n=1 Tax=Nannocystis pusilla TaxID=889268 RepID=UPI003BF056A6